MTTNTKDRCPHCKKEFCVHDHWVNRGDYGTQFETECPHCGKAIEVEVESVPLFRLGKPTCVLCNRRERPAAGHYCLVCRGRLANTQRKETP